jgi:CheY-like chemotaxis protein
LKRSPFIDVLLTDVVMPASGAELTRQLMQGRPALKVLYMSSAVLERPPSTAFAEDVDANQVEMPRRLQHVAVVGVDLSKAVLLGAGQV